MEKILNEILSELKEFKKETNERFNNIQEEISVIKTQQTENTQILRSLEHKADVMNAEMDNLKHQNARIEGTVNSIKEDVGELRKDINAVELITSKNWNDIVHLKAIK